MSKVMTKEEIKEAYMTGRYTDFEANHMLQAIHCMTSDEADAYLAFTSGPALLTADKLYVEKTLPSGFQIIAEWNNDNMQRPYSVTCIHSNGEDVHWMREFETEAQAIAEYNRFN